MRIRIGTRRSRLALAQTDIAVNMLEKIFPEIETEIIHISTQGDRITDKPLEKIGGRGVFIAEIEKALVENRIDIAVHSAKDLPVETADGTEISAVLKRGNPRDVIALRCGEKFDIHDKFTIGTGSGRRRAELSVIYPNAVFKDIRGNVDTRLQKLYNGEYDSLILAAAGLERLGMINDTRFSFSEFPEDEIIPAPCQGIIAIQSGQGKLRDILKEINDIQTQFCFEAERETMRLLNAGCTMPVGIYSFFNGNDFVITAANGGKTAVSVIGKASERFELAERICRQL